MEAKEPCAEMVDDALTAYAGTRGVFNKKAKFSAIDGEHLSEIFSVNGNEFYVSLKMSDVDKFKNLRMVIFLIPVLRIL